MFWYSVYFVFGRQSEEKDLVFAAKSFKLNKRG